MLVRFRFKNFRSIRDEQELSLVATSLRHAGPAPVAARGIPHGLLRAAAVYGANASGKSNVLKALNFLSGAVANSHKRGEPDGSIPIEPFLLDDSKNKPSLFEVEFLLRNTRYQYGFVLDSKVIHREWLYAFPPGRKLKRQLWFKRERGKHFGLHFGKKLSGENRVIERITRPNSLFLSAAAQNNHRLLSPLYRWLSEEINLLEGSRSGLTQVTASLCANAKTKKKIMSLLSPADLGVTDIRVRDEELSGEMKEILQVIRKKLIKEPAEELSIPETLPHIDLMHMNKNGGRVPFPIEQESSGTKSLFALLGPILRALKSGGVLCIDELEASLHPHLSREIVGMFTDPQRNPRGAQLLFSTHDTNLLDEDLLRRDAVWFTQKDRRGATHLYPLSDFAPRRNENLKRGYLQGRFGAIPFLDLGEHSTARRIK
jgi:AAA15 family ATPase/GTPase